MNDELEYVDELPAEETLPKGRNSKWCKVSDSLRKHPGRWAVIKTYARDETKQRPYVDRKYFLDGRAKGFTKGEFSIALRRSMADGKQRLYARYDGV